MTEKSREVKGATVYYQRAAIYHFPHITLYYQRATTSPLLPYITGEQSPTTSANGIDRVIGRFVERSVLKRRVNRSPGYSFHDIWHLSVCYEGRVLRVGAEVLADVREHVAILVWIVGKDLETIFALLWQIDKYRNLFKVKVK